ncbi:type I-E CRISPR-associated protein Cas5/CasD [Chloracidobacterium validum]|uniref:Type I-E CRISPR-associated protein Cas5/CasD n=1 Tax=Chloracidobacterium validum TaxID=2821543 RepID=A0ABX8BBH6_9BACT|nr:type I-E CRISPR-associated protein Cas5/CasD [Chloracidobacterium validum]QUW04039.1 type I-E CRISPR-associated protein Cas5/CasD [Chloracidobacterium validum]
MTCLLIRCVAPLQSWGSRSRFQERDTEREPTKSGMIGLIGAALGRDRTASVADLAALTMAVRVDAEGVLQTDFHTIQDIDPNGRYATKTELSRRAYLADAAFLVGLEGDAGLLGRIHAALANPVWPLFLGRKSFPPGLPLYLPDGLKEEPLRTVVETYPSVVPPGGKRVIHPERVRLVVECPPGDGEPRRDVPVSFAHGARHFMTRFVTTEWIPRPPTKPVEDASA